MPETAQTSDEIASYTGQDPSDEAVFHNRYPYPHELVRHGGIVGIEYCLIPAEKITQYSNMGWRQVNRVDPITIIGPKSKRDSIMLVCRGEPIPGSVRAGGLREWYVAQEIIDATGIVENIDSDTESEPTTTTKSNSKSASNKNSD